MRYSLLALTALASFVVAQDPPCTPSDPVLICQQRAAFGGSLVVPEVRLRSVPLRFSYFPRSLSELPLTRARSECRLFRPSCPLEYSISSTAPSTSEEVSAHRIPSNRRVYLIVNAISAQQLAPNRVGNTPVISFDNVIPGSNSGPLYTLVMLDYDSTVPSVLHWMQTDLTVQATTNLLTSNVAPAAQYAGPAPPQGSGVHRYVPFTASPSDQNVG